SDALDNWTKTPVLTNYGYGYGSAVTAAAYANGRYVTVGSVGGGDGGFIQTSEDGTDWTDRRSLNSFLLNLYDVTFANGTFVAVGYDYYFGTNLFHSTNGIHWFGEGNPNVGNMYGVTYGNGLFVAVGDGQRPQLIQGGGGTTNGNIFTSPDGSNWTMRKTPGVGNPNYTLFGVAFGNGRFVAIGQNNGGSTNYAFGSINGTTWGLGSWRSWIQMPLCQPIQKSAFARTGLSRLQEPDQIMFLLTDYPGH
ncbi:MAG TPA: hypothetical protein VLT36_13005, partial [Candidatus Dormibacteraeota bacterium]|nr:hypothetical protein [Candidatus Dormibacteraeota bacterium]